MGKGTAPVREAVMLFLVLTALELLQLSSAEGCCSLVPATLPQCISQCEETGPFWRCINGEDDDPDDHPGLQCCERTLNMPCREACTELLTGQVHIEADQVFDTLTGVCNDSQHIAVHPVVECIVANYNIPLSTTPHFPNLTKDGVDFARLHCCTKAVSAQCREDCFQYHASPTTTLFTKFTDDCRYDPHEYALYSCFEDVYAPSKPGCSDMRFCYMFNDHPAEFFRFCWMAEDNLAEEVWTRWHNVRKMDHVYLPQLIPLKDISLCQSEQWKTLACLLQIRPTDDEFHTTTVCREDCEQLMRACVDMNELSQLQLTINDICSKLAPSSSQEHCVHLLQFTDTTQTTVGHYDPVQQPCNREPCSVGEACVVNSDCSNGEQCPSYKCVPGCHVGLQDGLSSMTVPRPQQLKVVVPLVPYNKTQTLCHSFHTCSDTHLHLTAMELTGAHFHCELQAPCTVDAMEYAHGSVIGQECNICSCQNGRMVCTNWNCQLQHVTVIDDCSDVGVSPVCTPMGQTLRHPCHARERWAESKLTDGACSTQDGCRQHRCPTETRCIPIASVCVAASSDVCQNHICVQVGSSSNACTNAVSSQAVCDTSNQHYNSLCSLLTAQKSFSYWGACKSECAVSNPVCGVDGNTYATPCHAQGVSMAVDYDGSCVLTCDSVRCDPLPNEYCSAFTPPGACCPKCGGLVSMVVDSFQLQNSLPRMGMQQVTVRDFAARLEEKLNTLHCRVYAYLSQESSNTVYVLVTSTAPSTSMNQINACQAEAQAMVTRVNTEVLYYSMDSLLAHVVAAKHSSDLSIVIANASELEANSPSRAVTPFVVYVLLCAAIAIALHLSDITY